MDDRQHDYRGWDLWIQNGQVGCHIISQWDNDAIKVLTNRTIKPGEWNHLMVTLRRLRQGRGRDDLHQRRAAADDVVVNQLKHTTHTNVPFKIAQRNTTSRLDGALIQDVRLYNRSLSAPKPTRLAKTTRAAWLAAMPAAKRTKAEADELFAWWLVTRGQSRRGIGRPTGQPQLRAGRDQGSRHGEAQVMQERGGPDDGLCLVSRPIRSTPRAQ